MKPGRPPVDHDARLSVSVHVRVPAAQYDKLYADAQTDRVTIPEYLRRQLERRDRRKPDPR